MPLSLKAKAGEATFSLTDGAMKAEWTLTTKMSEEELVDALVAMLRYIKREQAVVPERHLHAVADRVEEQLPDVVQIQRAPVVGHGGVSTSAMTWVAPVQPRPLADSVGAAAGNGFELIPPDELD